MNFLPADRTADYLNTGVWSQKAIKEAKVLGGKVHVAASSESTNFDRIPKPAEIAYSANPAYVHLTTNNTIFGTQWKSEPGVPAGRAAHRGHLERHVQPPDRRAEVRPDLRRRAEEPGAVGHGAGDHPEGPGGGRTQDAADDAAVPHLRGGELALQHAARPSGSTWWARCSSGSSRRAASRPWPSTMPAKAKLLYDYIDASDFFRGTVQAGQPVADERLLPGARPRSSRASSSARPRSAGSTGSRGIVSVGGMRASIYNACPAGGGGGARRLHEGIRAGEPGGGGG